MKTAIYRGLGGWGDVEMALVAAGSYKLSKAHDFHLTFACPEQLLQLTENYPFVDQAISTKEFCNVKGGPYNRYFDITKPCLDYENKTQPNVDKSRIEIFCDWMGVEYNPLTLKSIPLTFSFLERSQIKKIKNRYKDRFTIGWITQSYSSIRRIPQRIWQEISMLVKENIPNCKNIIIRERRLAWEDMFWQPDDDQLILGLDDKRCVLKNLACCNLAIGPDTGPMHSAAMMGIPTIWLFTHIDGEVRTKEYPNTVVLQGKCPLDIGPCWYKGECEDLVAYNAPCSNFDIHIVFEEILSVYSKAIKSSTIISDYFW